MGAILWILFVVLLVFWLAGFFLFHLGSIIHIVLVIAIIMLVINLLTGRGARV